MRLIQTIIFLTLFGCATVDKITLDGEWVNVGQGRQLGIILDFRSQDEVVLSSIWKDTMVTLTYSIDKDRTLKVVRDGKTNVLGKVTAVSKDSLTLGGDGPTELNFLRIKDVVVNLNKKDLEEQIKNSSWSIKYGHDSIRMDFLSTHRWDEPSQPFESMFHYYWSDHSSYKEKEVWHIGGYGGKLFMYVTNNQSVDILRQILEVKNDEIVLSPPWLESFGQNDVITRLKKQSINLRANLTSKRWRSVHQDTVKLGEWGQLRDEDSDVMPLSLLAKQMEFHFMQDSTYLILIEGKDWKKGQWAGTSDGRFIVIDDPRNRNNWIQITQDEGHLVLSKTHKIKDGDRDYKLYNLTINLE